MMIPLNFSWLVPKRLAGLGRPTSKEDVTFLADAGVQHLVSLTELPPSLYGVKMNMHHIPVIDFAPPTILQVQEFLRLAEQAISRGEVSGTDLMYLKTSEEVCIQIKMLK